MGTRSLTVIQDNQGREIVVIYRQFDGYPCGHGQDLAEFLKEYTLVNGFQAEQTMAEHYANGMSCLAAQLVRRFKTEIGGFYLHPAGTRDCGASYFYVVKPSADGDRVAIEAQTSQYRQTGEGVVRLPESEWPVIFDGLASDWSTEAVEAADDKACE